MKNIQKIILSELLGTAILLTVVIGSGIMGERLSSGNVAIALLANTFATVWGLYFLIETFGPISGAHFNPAVSLIMFLKGELTRNKMCLYIVSQLVGAILGAFLANTMFEIDLFQLSTKTRTGYGIWIGEVVATAGLIFIILHSTSTRVSSAVAAYIGSAYWFTSSTSFANPAAAIGRMFSNTFAGIEPTCVSFFVFAQIIGAFFGYYLYQMTFDCKGKESAEKLNVKSTEYVPNQTL